MEDFSWFCPVIGIAPFHTVFTKTYSTVITLRKLLAPRSIWITITARVFKAKRGALSTLFTVMIRDGAAVIADRFGGW